MLYPHGLLEESKGSPRPFSQVAGKFPTPSDHIAGNTRIWFLVMPNMRVAYTKDTGSTRKACPRHLHNTQGHMELEEPGLSARSVCKAPSSPRANPRQEP